jgi:hypothetical protein
MRLWGKPHFKKQEIVGGFFKLGLEKQWLQVGGNFFLFVSFHS